MNLPEMADTDGERLSPACRTVLRLAQVALPQGFPGGASQSLRRGLRVWLTALSTKPESAPGSPHNMPSEERGLEKSCPRAGHQTLGQPTALKVCHRRGTHREEAGEPGRIARHKVRRSLCAQPTCTTTGSASVPGLRRRSYTGSWRSPSGPRHGPSSVHCRVRRQTPAGPSGPSWWGCAASRNEFPPAARRLGRAVPCSPSVARHPPPGSNAAPRGSCRRRS